MENYIITGNIKNLSENYLASHLYYFNGGVVMARWRPYGWEIKKVDASPFTTPSLIREFNPGVVALHRYGDVKEQPFPIRRGIWLFHSDSTASFLKRLRKLSYVRRIIELNLAAEKGGKFVMISNDHHEPLLIGDFCQMNGTFHSVFPL